MTRKYMMARFPIAGRRSYGRAPDPHQTDAIQPTAATQPNAATTESVDNREEIPHELVKSYYPVLHPSRMNGAKWFKNNTEISTRVRKIIEGCFKGLWYSWKKTKYRWDASIDNLVQAHFDKLAATRLKGMVSLAKSNASKPNGEKPDWIMSEHWRVMLAYWRTPSAKTKSEKARASRLSDRNGLGTHRHIAGSRSYAKIQDVLEANNGYYSFIAVVKRTHQKSDGTFVDERARKIAEKYDECVQERLSHMDEEGLTLDSLTLEEKK